MMHIFYKFYHYNQIKQQTSTHDVKFKTIIQYNLYYKDTNVVSVTLKILIPTDINKNDGKIDKKRL